MGSWVQPQPGAAARQVSRRLNFSEFAPSLFVEISEICGNMGGSWEGPDLVKPSEPWDNQFAHKPWILKHGGVVYHFYCAVGSQGRVIALATSRDLRAASEK